MRLVPCLVTSLLLVAIPFQAYGAFTASIALDQTQMANVTVNAKQSSIRWRIVDQTSPVLVTLFFHSYNNSGLILDEGLIANGRFGYPSQLQEPNGLFTVKLTSTTLTQDGRLVFEIVTDQSVPQISLSRFTGVTGPDVGLPGDSLSKSVLTARNEVVDVLANNVWVASFTWDSVKFENQTLPQVIVYDTTGAQIDGRLITRTNVQLLPVRGSSGFWLTAQEILSNGITWFLQSDFPLVVKPNQGFQTKTLPFITADQLLRADNFAGRPPEASVSWLLPIGANQYDLFIGGFKMPTVDVSVLLDMAYAPGGVFLNRDANTGIYTLKFKPLRVGVTVPVTIETVAADGKYSSITHVAFRPLAFMDPESSFNYLHASLGGMMGSLMAVLGVMVYRRRRPKEIDIRILEDLLKE